MENFSFHNPTKLVFGKGQIAQLSREVPKKARVLVTYGGGSIRSNGVYDQVKQALDGVEWQEFGGIEANPSFETLMKAVALVRSEGIDYLLAVGGGSVVDGTKFIAAAARFEGDPWDLCAKHAAVREALPMGVVLTLPATGSESNSYAVISRAETKEKLAFGSPLLYPRFAILDPETTYSLPPRQVSNGIVDAFVHVMEQYLTYPAGALIQDRFAEGILRSLVEVGPTALAEPRNYEARANLVWCATMALNGLIGVGVPQDWSTHSIGHELTAFHGLDHAQTLAIVLPSLLWVQRSSKREKLLQYAERVWDLREGDAEERISAAIERTRTFFEQVGNPTHLSAYGVGGERFEELASRLESRRILPMGERKDLGRTKLEAILAGCL